MKTGKTDFVGFIVWPVVGGVDGWLVAAVCYLTEMTSSDPTGELGLFLLVVGSVLATSTWAGRHQPGCYPVLWGMILLFGLLLHLLAPRISSLPRQRSDRVEIVFGRKHYFFEYVDLIAAGTTITAIYGLVRWSKVCRDAEESE